MTEEVISKVFRTYASEINELGEPLLLFAIIRPALTALFGHSIPSSEIKQHFKNNMTEYDVCGIDYDQFCKLVLEVQNARKWSEDDYHMLIYRELDSNNKGMVSLHDFHSVYQAIAPQSASCHAKDIFAMADTYSIGQVSLLCLPSFLYKSFC